MIRKSTVRKRKRNKIIQKRILRKLKNNKKRVKEA